MRDTSLEAYEAIIKKLPEKRLAVLAHIELRGSHGATLFELTNFMKRPVNEISGRVTELKQAGLIIENGKRENPDTGKKATVWILESKEKLEPPPIGDLKCSDS